MKNIFFIAFHREMYNRKIQEQETLGKNLRDRQKAVRENHVPSMKQMKMWRDVLRLVEAKQGTVGQQRSTDDDLRGQVHESEERLVL